MKATILVIDDDMESNEVLSSFLEQNGHEVVKAYTGDDGLKALSAKKPDADRR